MEKSRASESSAAGSATRGDDERPISRARKPRPQIHQPAGTSSFGVRRVANTQGMESDVGGQECARKAGGENCAPSPQFPHLFRDGHAGRGLVSRVRSQKRTELSRCSFGGGPATRIVQLRTRLRLRLRASDAAVGWNRRTGIHRLRLQRKGNPLGSKKSDVRAIRAEPSSAAAALRLRIL